MLYKQLKECKTMSTRSEIAVQVKDSEEIRSIYCHSDGYVDYNGRMLQNNYNSYDLAMSIINENDCSVLCETITESRFYNTWRDEGTKYKSFEREYFFMETFNHDIFAEYIYLFKNDEWHVSELKWFNDDKAYNQNMGYHTKFIPLSYAIAKLNVKVANKEIENIFA